MDSNTETQYGVARDDKVIGGAIFTDLETARRQLAWVESTMRDVGLEPDVRLVEVDIETIVHPLRDYVEPEPEPQPEPEEPETTYTNTDDDEHDDDEGTTDPKG